MEKEDGVWRTIRGRKIFIASGQSLGDAMSKSGKFKREDIREGKKELRGIDRANKNRNIVKSNMNIDKKIRKIEKNEHKYAKHELRDNDFKNQDRKNIINEKEDIIKQGERRIDKNAMRYSKRDENELRHEELQKKLADYKARKQEELDHIDDDEALKDWRIYRDRYQKSLDRATNPESKEKFRQERDLANKEIEKIKEYQAKKQSNNKIDNKKENTKQMIKRTLRENGISQNDLDRYTSEGKDIFNKDFANEEEVLDYLGLSYLTKDKQSNNKVDNEYHFAGEELYSDNPHRYDDTIKSAEARKEKFKADSNFKKEKHIGWGDYNKDGVPVYDNDIDYKGDFGWANLKSLSDDDLTKALNIQSEEYHKANAESVGDLRTRNGRMNKIFKDAKVGKYEQGMKKISEEMQKRDMPRYNIYDKNNPNNILVSSPTKEMADKQIQDMYKTDMKLGKHYGWKELPKYDYRVGKVDDYLNEIKEKKNKTIKDYKKKKGK